MLVYNIKGNIFSQKRTLLCNFVKSHFIVQFATMNCKTHDQLTKIFFLYNNARAMKPALLKKPSLQLPKLMKNTRCLSQSAFSNFFLYVIKHFKKS